MLYSIEPNGCTQHAAKVYWTTSFWMPVGLQNHVHRLYSLVLFVRGVAVKAERYAKVYSDVMTHSNPDLAAILCWIETG